MLMLMLMLFLLFVCASTLIHVHAVLIFALKCRDEDLIYIKNVVSVTLLVSVFWDS